LHQDQAGTIDQNYFNGDVYQNYEMSSGMFPSQILERIADYRALEGRLLDVGCATGQLVEHACQQKLDAEGVDVSAWAVARAQERNGNRCRVLNLDGATKADFAAPYDIVVLHSVLEHLAEPARALRLLFEITRPGAIVYIQTLNADSLLHLLQKESWSGYSDYTHLSPWITRDWLGDEATRAGFEVRQLKCYGVWNDNRLDPAWRSFGALLQTAPTNVLLEEQFGDFTEAILQRPHQA
jgi:SAM-dependent methyltransferase